MIAAFQRVKKASQSFPRQRKIKFKSFSTGACTSWKIHISLRVWNLDVIDGQIMLGSGCKSLSENPEGVFRQSKAAI